ncbi:MAG: bifunctional phosphoribosylaminoimidazolecarboxamide formyltransferase/IMP cyclohydrolase [Aestuariivirgaceae bacterium]
MASDQSIKIRRALISLSDKTGLAEFARGLIDCGVTLLSTGGTARTIAEAGLAVSEIETVTGFPEILGGRVKTLHPKVHGGLLGIRGDVGHEAEMAEHGIAPIDLVAVTLYPFEDARRRGASRTELIEAIDIGGPAMIRAAAKNSAAVTVVVDPADYPVVLEAMRKSGGAVPVDLRRALAAKAFTRTAAYDAMIGSWLSAESGGDGGRWAAVGGRLIERLRYGENPQQTAAFYATGEPRRGVATARQLQGKELSYNNIADADAAFECVAEFAAADAPAAVIVKHANPCGAALGTTLEDAYRLALRADPVSAFGGIVAFNRPLDEAAARVVSAIFTEVVMAPGADEDAMAILAQAKNLRVLVTDGMPDPAAAGMSFRSVAGGLLVQSRDNAAVDPALLKVVTRAQPSADEMADMLFAMKVAKHVKSNAIVLAKGGATVGIGAGQMSRVDSCRVAIEKAKEAARAAGLERPLSEGAVVASDAFFPFPDGLLAAVAGGARAVIQPGGSVRDKEVIAAADAAGISMVFTGLRHFRH